MAQQRSGVAFAQPASEALAPRLLETRRLSLELAEPLTPEDMTVQPMDDASPTKWHLAHVTWFFETFILVRHLPGYAVFDESFNYCFNSYYESQGPRQPRPRRGLLTRPSSRSVLAYRAHVDDGAFFSKSPSGSQFSPGANASAEAMSSAGSEFSALPPGALLILTSFITEHWAAAFKSALGTMVVSNMSMLSPGLRVAPG